MQLRCAEANLDKQGLEFESPKKLPFLSIGHLAAISKVPDLCLIKLHLSSREGRTAGSTSQRGSDSSSKTDESNNRGRNNDFSNISEPGRRGCGEPSGMSNRKGQWRKTVIMARLVGPQPLPKGHMWLSATLHSCIFWLFHHSCPTSSWVLSPRRIGQYNNYRMQESPTLEDHAHGCLASPSM